MPEDYFQKLNFHHNFVFLYLDRSKVRIPVQVRIYLLKYKKNELIIWKNAVLCGKYIYLFLMSILINFAISVLINILILVTLNIKSISTICYQFTGELTSSLFI